MKNIKDFILLEKEEKQEDDEMVFDKDVEEPDEDTSANDDEDPEKVEKELIEFFKEQGSKDPEKDAAEYLKNMYGDPDDPNFQEELKKAEEEAKKEGKSSKTNESITINEASIVGRLLTGSLIRSTVRAHLAKRRMVTLKMQMNKETDPKKLKKLETAYNMVEKSNFDKKGRPRAVVFNCRQALAGVKGIAQGAGIGNVLKNCTTIGKAVGAVQTLKAEKENPDEYAEAFKFVQKNMDRTKRNTDKKEEEPKEEVIKDKDGSEIHARPKKTGKGNTYVRIKNGKEIGYATKDEFQAAKQKKAKAKNESLIDYLRECLK